jgi:hypothetical protein
MDKFQNDVLQLVSKSGLSLGEVLGVLELVKFDLVSQKIQAKKDSSPVQ